MPVSQSFLDMLVDMLAPIGPVSARRMFGGAGLYSNDVMFAIIDDDALYLKGNEASAAKFEAEGCGKFTYDGKSKPVSMSYWRAPERLFDDPDELVAWARDAITASQAKKRASASGRRKTRS